MTWRCAQIFYHDDQDGLVLDCVRPLIDELAGAYFVRHWRLGPHVRLCLPASDEAFAAVRPRILAAVERYLAAHPSTAVIDEPRLLAIHRTLAFREKERGPLTPLAPDNSVRFEPHDRRLDVLGHEAAAALLERFYHETNAQVFAALEAVRGGASRLTIALDLMLATAHAQWPDIRRGFLSLRSHAEGLIVQAPDPAACRAWCEARYRAQAATVQARLAAVLDDLDHDRDTVPFVRAWVTALARFRAAADPLIADGTLGFAGARWDGDATWDPAMLAASPFHRALQHNPARLAFMREDLGFLGYRLVLNYLYLHLGRLGIKPIERLVLCYLAATAVEQRFGLAAEELVAP